MLKNVCQKISCEHLFFCVGGLADFRQKLFFVFALHCKAYSLQPVPRETNFFQNIIMHLFLLDWVLQEIRMSVALLQYECIKFKSLNCRYVNK